MNPDPVFPASLPKRVVDSTFPARIALACAFPVRMGYRGACTTLADLSRHGIAHPLFTPTKQDAAHLIMRANMET